MSTEVIGANWKAITSKFVYWWLNGNAEFPVKIFEKYMKIYIKKYMKMFYMKYFYMKCLGTIFSPDTPIKFISQKTTFKGVPVSFDHDCISIHLI